MKVKKCLEKEVEEYFRNELRKRGCLVMKFVSPGFSGVPDRIVVFPYGRIEFVELKRPGEKPRGLQKAVMRMFLQRRVAVHVLSSNAEVDRFVERMEAENAFEEEEF